MRVTRMSRGRHVAILMECSYRPAPSMGGAREWGNDLTDRPRTKAGDLTSATHPSRIGPPSLTHSPRGHYGLLTHPHGNNLMLLLFPLRVSQINISLIAR